MLVIIDQFEELVTFTPASDGVSFVAALLELTDLRPGSLVVTVRADHFYSAITVDTKLRERVDDGGLVTLGPMTEEELRDVIVKPSHLVGVKLEPGLVDHILKDCANEAGSLPLLEYALASMGSETSEQVTIDDYHRAGGIVHSIGKTAERIYDALSLDEAKACRALALRLVRVASNGPVESSTKQAVAKSSLTSREWTVAERLAAPETRLCVIFADLESGEQTVEIAHEQLIVSWPHMIHWLREDQEFLTWRQRHLDSLPPELCT